VNGLIVLNMPLEGGRESGSRMPRKPLFSKMDRGKFRVSSNVNR